MIQLSAETAAAYLRDNGRAGSGEILVQAMTSQDGPPNSTVMKIFDTAGGDKVGSDTRSPAQIRQGKPDTRMTQGACFIVKQPLQAGGEERLRTERACIELLDSLMPEGSVPRVLWHDETNHILAMSCAPADAFTWKKHLAGGGVAMDAATHAGMLLAMMHSSTKKDPAIKERFSAPKAFLEARVDPLFKAPIPRNNDLARMLQDATFRVKTPLCLIHGDFTPGNILLAPAAEQPAENGKPAKFAVAQVMIVDFDTVFFGHAAFDVTSLLAELLLVGFMRGTKWRSCMMMADNFWQTYRHTADPDLVKAVDVAGGRVLGATLLGRIDGSRPVEGLAERRTLPEKVRKVSTEILKKSTISLDEALDAVSMHFDVE